MIYKQKLFVDGNKFKLRNTIDIGMAKSLANDVSKDGGARTKHTQLLGYIPPEMWAYDPWLVSATRAAAGGDKAEHQRLVMKFFEVHPYLKVATPKKYHALGGY